MDLFLEDLARGILLGWFIIKNVMFKIWQPTFSKLFLFKNYYVYDIYLYKNNLKNMNKKGVVIDHYYKK